MTTFMLFALVILFPAMVLGSISATVALTGEKISHVVAGFLTAANWVILIFGSLTFWGVSALIKVFL